VHRAACRQAHLRALARGRAALVRRSGEAELLAETAKPTAYTVGHGSRSGAELLALLREAGVALVADVRRFPHSRRHPQHDGAALERSLAEGGVRYVWLGEGLGGRVPETVPPERSRNAAWREPAFRRYADAMATPVFQAAFAELEECARGAPTALLCSERLWWRCHRRLLADLLEVRGWRVLHLLEPGKRTEHERTPFARLEQGALVYPAP
jgi:uncharacterized protein (DUF488 family)